jgi:two-component system KDP operon response regulator KdpE
LSSQPLILVVDDEARLARLVSIALSAEGFRVVIATSGEEAVARSEQLRPDVVILDLMMPDLDGFEVMNQIRVRRRVPIILLTGRSSMADKTKGLDLGADDYLAKPFHPDELAARVRAIIRRAGDGPQATGIIECVDSESDLDQRIVRRAGQTVAFSRTEWMLLQHLATNADKVVLHAELLTKIWGAEYSDDLQYLRVWISRVRRKLGATPGQPGRIRTFQGIGYLLAIDDASQSSGHGTPAEELPSTRDIVAT